MKCIIISIGMLLLPVSYIGYLRAEVDALRAQNTQLLSTMADVIHNQTKCIANVKKASDLGLKLHDQNYK